jgi:hypothetical protein
MKRRKEKHDDDENLAGDLVDASVEVAVAEKDDEDNDDDHEADACSSKLC